MSRPVAVLRPEPGNAATAARLEAFGLTAIRLPLFETHAIDWIAPNPERFDALVLTSANAPRLAGPALATFAHLPVYAVGQATAEAAHAAGLSVVEIGRGDARALIAKARDHDVRRALHLSGRERAVDPGGIIADAVAVYASDPIAADVSLLEGAVALLHSPRAARRLSALIDDGLILREHVTIAALSSAIAAAAGDGWRRVVVATTPSDAALIDCARDLTD
jgi:uroporphyrinogen-III synthase